VTVVRWTPQAADDLQAIYDFIARDSPHYAQLTVEDLLAATPAATVQTTFYSVGVVTSTNPKFPSVEIEHEEIKGLMPAMTMEFYVSDKAMLNDLKPGDRISFTMTNGVGGLKITEIKKR